MSKSLLRSGLVSRCTNTFLIVIAACALACDQQDSKAHRTGEEPTCAHFAITRANTRFAMDYHFCGRRDALPAAPAQPMRFTRRTFLHRALITPVVVSLAGRCAAGGKDARPLRFGIITDVHQDVMHDGVERVRAFVEAMIKAQVDFVIQLGDFCVPHERNRPFLGAWNMYKGTKYHVLGNHDVDGGFKAEQTLAYWGMQDLYYTFDAGPVRGIVLNGNERGGKAKGYPRFIGDTQLAWLEADHIQTGLTHNGIVRITYCMCRILPLGILR